jgi:hypothetical protein
MEGSFFHPMAQPHLHYFPTLLILLLLPLGGCCLWV